MLSTPDIVVLSADLPDVSLIADVESGGGDLRASEQQLRRYMIARRCPVGLLVTPDKTWLYRDTFADYSEHSIEQAGEFATSDLLGASPVPRDELALHRLLQDWLERLSKSWWLNLPLLPELRESMMKYLVPNIVQGRVVSQIAA